VIESSRYSIGIDLGTTNSALSYIDLTDETGVSLALSIPQRDSYSAFVEKSTLPSFLYLPTDGERALFAGNRAGFSGDWAVGEIAWRMTSEQPGRTIASAKSWLGHHSVDPTAKILPWDSAEVSKEHHLSPLEAATAYLSYLRSVWDESIGESDSANAFARQSITVTVPASFDASAQELTLRAAREAGFPATTRLLEEPQAAFYRCLERSTTRAQLEAFEKGDRILVVDIGGGTSDFSLFRVGERKDDAPSFDRIAVSEHILLGGDNIDLALAHALESEVKGGDGELSPGQWQYLIARSRELKERCLGSELDEELSVALPSSGSSLLSGSRSATVSSSDIRSLLLEGFFPLSSKEAHPEQGSEGLREWGLPYAPDFAVTRYLAEFVRPHGRIDAVLFNGGTLAATVLRERLVSQLAAWQGDSPRVIGNSETDLAVARGAAFYGSTLEGRGRLIDAGASRSTFLGVSSEAGGEELICVLPKGTNPGAEIPVVIEGLRLRVNETVRFDAYQGNGMVGGMAGERMALMGSSFTKLPPLETKIEVEDSRRASDNSIRISLESSINELGLLEIKCVSSEYADEWVLRFNTRTDEVAAAEDTSQSEVEETGETAAARLTRYFAGKAFREKLTANRIFRGLEEETGLKRHEWNLSLSRKLGDAALELGRAESEVWVHVVGYLMRPGFGSRNDSERMDRVWDLMEMSALEGGGGLDTQRCILWRRLSGGLDEARQATLFDREFSKLSISGGANPERLRMLGVLERISLDRKRKLFEYLVGVAKTALEEDGAPVSVFAALGSLLSRSLLYASPEDATPPEWVLDAFEVARKVDWSEQRYFDAQSLFMRAARIVETRSLNLPSSVSKKIIRKLSKSGLADARLLPLAEYAPLSRMDQTRAFGESLPAGLSIVPS